jgi:hypothetical protein
MNATSCIHICEEMPRLSEQLGLIQSATTSGLLLYELGCCHATLGDVQESGGFVLRN